MRAYVAESATAVDFFERRWEGHVVEEIVRLLGGRVFYRIVMTSSLLDRALNNALNRTCDVFHLSCHGDELGIQLTDGTDLSWDELALKFERATYAPKALVLSSCIGGDRGAARAFQGNTFRPDVIFGSEADEPLEITFPGACVAWPILYTELSTLGMARSVFREAVDKMNRVTIHRFVYWRLDDDRYLRYPPRP
jgi:hypothetical protein